MQANVMMRCRIVFGFWFCVSCLALQSGLAQDTESAFPEIYNSETVPGDPISPADALAALRLPDGFSATLFAAEPDVQNPIAACTDARGRVWIAENYTYAERSQHFDLNLNDRVVVLEDADGDGVAEKRTVFTDTVKMLTGITVGRGGVWLMCPPQLLFIPDADGDLVPDGPPQVRLDGFTVTRENYHNFANGLSWGPDNWLYGRCGASCAGEMGLPGSVDEQRVPVRGGMWRFHPERKVVESLNQGTTNPWGHDWNENGDLFFINTVNGHFWHSIPGAHYVRPHTIDVNPHVYELIDMHADHWHFDTGKSWTDSRDGAANDYGGGHAHIGMMIYQESRWPVEYHGNVMTVNMHGRRINRERLASHGSGYLASHEADFVQSDDTWFRGMEVLPIADGNVLLVDWSDTGECHDHTGVHRTSGRIFKISYAAGQGTRALALSKEQLSDPTVLAKLQVDGTTWQSRRARERLAELGLLGHDVTQAVGLLRDVLADAGMLKEVRLRALWALVALNQVEQAECMELLASEESSLRDWGVRLLSDRWSLDYCDGRRSPDAGKPVGNETVARLVAMAKSEADPAVRLTLASTLQRLPLEQRKELAKALLAHAADANDHNLPLMLWYGVTGLGAEHTGDLVEVLESSQWPTTTRLMARRIADQSKVAPQHMERMVELAMTRPTAFGVDVVLGMSQALAGWRSAPEPKDWPELKRRLDGSQDAAVRSALQNLSILFGDGRTTDELMKVASDRGASRELRQAALQSLVDARAEGTKALCLSLLSERFLNNVAAAGLARENDPEVGAALVRAYKRFHPFDRSRVVSILTSRPAWAAALLEAVAAKQIDRTEISAFQARQIASHNDAAVDGMLKEHWGEVRGSSAEKKTLMASLRGKFSPDALAAADKHKGRAIFQKSCSSCHMLFGAGGKLGPDLTGAQRSNIDYLLENIVDPSAVVTKEFRATILLLDDGRVLTGLVTNQTENVVTLATQNETFKIATDEITQMKQSGVSTMPDGLLEQLSEQQCLELFAYLQSQEQVDEQAGEQ